jgi:hypothetical protein
MSLYDKIIAIYPELKDTPEVFANGTIVLQNDSDGEGDYLAKWDHKTLAQPTAEQLEA